ncbi:hypothetical protein M758_12G076600, partial [Ceratodon purpureus]
MCTHSSSLLHGRQTGARSASGDVEKTQSEKHVHGRINDCSASSPSEPLPASPPLPSSPRLRAPTSSYSRYSSSSQSTHKQPDFASSECSALVYIERRGCGCESMPVCVGVSVAARESASERARLATPLALRLVMLELLVLG